MPESADVEVTLLKPHTHAGVQYPKGASICVPTQIVPWLTRRGVIRDTGAAGKPKE